MGMQGGGAPGVGTAGEGMQRGSLRASITVTAPAPVQWPSVDRLCPDPLTSVDPHPAVLWAGDPLTASALLPL